MTRRRHRSDLAYAARAILTGLTLAAAWLGAWVAACNGHPSVATAVMAVWIVVAGIAWNRDPA